MLAGNQKIPAESAIYFGAFLQHWAIHRKEEFCRCQCQINFLNNNWRPSCISLFCRTDALLAQMPIEELRDFCKPLLRLGGVRIEQVLSVGHAFEYLQGSLHA